MGEEVSVNKSGANVKNKRRVMAVGVPGHSQEWWLLVGAKNKKAGRTLSAMLTEAFNDGSQHGISTACFELERLCKSRKL